MMKKLIICFVLVGLYVFGSYVTAFFSVCAYESSDRHWSDYDAPFKGVTIIEVRRYFSQYTADKERNNVFLCRTSKKSWANPFAWPDYLIGERWQLPYIEPTPGEILRQRKLDALNQTSRRP